jgi:hypothetical protein
MAKSSPNGFNEFCPFLINQLASDTSLLMFFIFFTEIVLMAGQYDSNTIVSIINSSDDYS